MHFLRSLPIKRKLMVITMLVSSIALLVVGLSFITYEQSTSRKRMVQDLSITATMTGANTTAGLTFNEPDSVEETMKSLSAEPAIVHACVYSRDGNPFADYQRDDLKGKFSPPPVESDGYHFTNNRLKLFQRIDLAGEKVGSIYLEMDLHEMTVRTWRYVQIMFLVLLISAVIAFFLSAWLQKFISEPLLDLAQTVTIVAQEKKYSVRAKKQSDDELGQLIDGFNEMLAQIQERDATLEHRVEERTQELQRENAERRQAEEALRESQLLYYSLVEQMPAGVFRKDDKGRFVFANSWFCRLKDMKLDQIIGLTPSAVTAQELAQLGRQMLPETRESSLAALAESHHELIMRTGQTIELEEEYFHANGEVQYLHVVKYPMFDTAGKITGSQGILFDVTERKQAEAAIRESEDRYRSLVSASPDAVIVTNIEGRVEFVSTRTLEIFDYPSEDAVIGRNMIDSVAPEEREMARAKLRDLLVTKRHHGSEITLLKKDGSPFNGEINAVLLSSADGKPKGMMFITRDITERKRAEAELAYERELFQVLMDNLPDSIYFKDRESRLVRAGKSKVAETFQTVRDSYRADHPAAGPDEWPAHLAAIEPFTCWLIGKTDFDTYPEAHARAAFEDEQNIMRTGQPIVGKIQKASFADGRAFWWLSEKMPWRNPAGEIIGTFGISKDITSIKEVEVRLAKSLSLLNATLESTADGILVVDRLDRVTSYNSRFVDMCQLPREKIVAGKDDEVLPLVVEQMKDGKAFLAKVLKLYRQPEAESFDLLELKDGRIFERYSKPQRLGDECVGRVWCFRDITERKRAEAELAFERELLRALLDTSEDKIYFKDAQSRFIRCSKNQSRQFQAKSVEELEGKSDFDFFTEEHARPAFLDEQEIIRTGKPLLNKMEKETYPDGHVTWALTNKMPFHNLAGKIIGTFGISKDVTAIKQAEDQARWRTALFEAVVNSSLDGILVVSSEGKTIIQNQQTIALWKIPKEVVERMDDSVQAAHVMQMAKNPNQFLERVSYLYAHPNETGREEVELNDGTILDRYTAPAMGDDGTCYGRIWMFRDITQRKQAELELEKVHRQLVDASRQAGMAEVATSVLHNVGNVLNSVNVSTTLVLDIIKKSRINNLGPLAALIREHQDRLAEFFTTDPKGRQLPDYLVRLAEHLGGEQAEQLKEIELTRQNIEHIKDIVAMQQSYARISGVVEMVEVVDLVEDALRLNGGALARHDVQVIRDYPAQAIQISVERHKVLQILVNLIRNAKYACDDSGRTDKRLTIQVRNGGNRALIAVMDNGVGIPAENMTRIFNHGFTTREKGHGFGLHSGALAAKELGGNLSVQSDGPGTGANFIIELPLQPPQTYE